MRHALLRNIRRIVIKLGTGVLTDAQKRPDLVQFAQLVAQLAALRAAGLEVIVVSSGAVGSGMGVLGLARRPRELAELQACAAVGQSRLMALYESLFRHYNLAVAQVLLTHEDLAEYHRHRNARKTLLTLLKHGVIPIINENDAVSVTELKFGDNDRLSALVATLLPADLLVILTTADGLIEGFGSPQPRLRSIVETIDPATEAMAGGTQSTTAVGGMIAKITAAKIVVRSGIPLVIASGKKFDALQRIIDGADEGTLFVPGPANLRAKKRWIAFYHRPAGTLTIDDGARDAICASGGSLLAPGIASVQGEFPAAAVVSIADRAGRELARGVSRWSSHDLRQRSGSGEVVHRDELVLL